MKTRIFATMLASAIALPAHALTEPSQLTEGPNGDSHYRKAEIYDGGVIQLMAARGQTLMVEIPKNIEIFSVLPSDQDVMTNTVISNGGPLMGESRQTPPNSTGSDPAADESGGCSTFTNLQVCIRRGRFIFFKPLTYLDPQSVSVILLQKSSVPGRDPIERTIIFQIQAKPGDAIYYAVRLSMPEQEHRASPTSAPAASVARPTSRAASGQPRSPTPIARALPPTPVNRGYTIEGDANLLGTPGR